MKLFKNISYFFFSLCLALLFLEGAFRVYASWYKFSLTQLYKNEKRSARKLKILAVGESTTAGLWVEDRSYPLQLKEKIEKYYSCNGCVDINIVDLPGGNSSITLDRLPSYLIKLKPDLVIFMEGYNDFSFYEYNIDTLLLEHFFTHNQFIYDIYLNIVESLNEVRIFRVAKLIYVTFTMPRDTYLDTEVIFNNHGQISNTRKKFAESKPINEFIRRQMETNIEKMIDITRMNNATPILMTYHIKGINNTIKAVAKNKQVYLIDNEAEFLKLENRSDYIFKMSPEHPNAKGYEVIAQNIIDHLIMWNIVRKPFPNAR